LAQKTGQLGQLRSSPKPHLPRDNRLAAAVDWAPEGAVGKIPKFREAQRSLMPQYFPAGRRGLKATYFLKK